MKKILLLSDTHSHLDERMLVYAHEADEIWHAGDIGDLAVTDRLAKIKPLRAVYGNIDGANARAQFPENNPFYTRRGSFFNDPYWWTSREVYGKGS